MRIGIDISQLAYPNTGVANYLKNLVESLVEVDNKNEYVLFFSSMRKTIRDTELKIQSPTVKVKSFRFPPSLLDLLWNRLHVVPIEWFLGDVDVFITSDWLEPPAKKALKVTILYDLVVYKFPTETDEKIVKTQRRKLEWVKKESDRVFCISESTKKDVMETLGIEEKKIKVVYPGL